MPAFRTIAFFATGFMVGGGAGIYGTWRYLQGPAEPHHEVRYHGEELDSNELEDWLYEPGTQIQDIYRGTEEALAAITKPDSIEVHQVDEHGTLETLGYKFSDAGVKPDEEHFKTLVHALGSISTYRPMTACGFSPAVLARITKDGKIYDFVFCFQCNDMIWADKGGQGMTNAGRGVLLKAFCEMLPDFTALQNLRKHR